MPDDLGDARSRAEAQGFREQAERRKSADPAYAYAPRWVPSGNWRMGLGDVLVIVFGVGLLLMVFGMKLFGVF